MPSQPESNSKGQYMVESSNTFETFLEHTKSVMTLRNGRVIEEPSKTNNETLIKSEVLKDKEDPTLRDEPTPLALPYPPKVSFSSALEFFIPFNEKGERIDEMLELFK